MKLLRRSLLSLPLVASSLPRPVTGSFSARLIALGLLAAHTSRAATTTPHPICPAPALQPGTCSLASPFAAYRAFSSAPPPAATMPADPDKQAVLRAALTPTLLEDLRQFWFKDFKDGDYVAPSQEVGKRWFMRSDEFDNACLAQFGAPIHAIQSVSATADDVLAAVAPLSSALDWLSLIILLDQIPRNIFRGDAARTAFEVFDPISLAVAQRALAQDVPRSDPRVRYRPARRSWFYMPLMHAEDRAMHELALREHDAMIEEVRALRDGPEPPSEDADLRSCRELLVRSGDGVERYMEMGREFEVKHKVIIERFGRYPHRNKVLGREAREEERRYLEDGGDTFAQ